MKKKLSVASLCLAMILLSALSAFFLRKEAVANNKIYGVSHVCDCLIAMSSFVGGTAKTDANAEQMTSMRVLWTVSGYVIGKNSLWGETEAKSLLFKPLDINESTIVFSGQTCSGVNFERKTVDANTYLNEVWQVTPEFLGISESTLTVVSTDCVIPGFKEYMRLTDGRLIVPINGVFFIFAPTIDR